MSEQANDTWVRANQIHLGEALAEVRRALERHALQESPATQTDGESSAATGANRALPVSSALDAVCLTFGLSAFERAILVLCAGMELDSTFAPLCAAAQNDRNRPYPTFSLALSALPDPHWSALTPAAPLRRWRMIDIGDGASLTTNPLRIDEWVLHYLAGASHVDERLSHLIDHVEPVADMAGSHKAIAERLITIWRGSRNVQGMIPVTQLCGGDPAAMRNLAAAAAASAGMNLLAMSARDLPQSPVDLEILERLWEREAALRSCALLLECHDMDRAETTTERSLARVLERTNGVIILATRERRQTGSRRLFTFDVDRPTREEQKMFWQSALGKLSQGLTEDIDRITEQFSMNVGAILAVRDHALGQSQPGSENGETGRLLWSACLDHQRPRLEDLAQRIRPSAGWDDLVLPPDQMETLKQIVAHLRQRAKVYDRWGFAGKGSRGLGISALFAGLSGVGKTMAAEVLANALRLDLYRIDLSSVVSKYIGETEKNLRRVFDAAEEGGAILLFDEADALFGKRSEVKDSHDRYANIEVSYLLQRMEAYRGLAILTTNLKDSLDSAFLRRIRFVVQFPFPDARARAEIWRKIFPRNTPVDELDLEVLARLNVSGGNIRNIALNGAFLAADADEKVSMRHLMAAAKTEFTKLEKPMTGW